MTWYTLTVWPMPQPVAACLCSEHVQNRPRHITALPGCALLQPRAADRPMQSLRPARVQLLLRQWLILRVAI